MRGRVSDRKPAIARERHSSAPGCTEADPITDRITWGQAQSVLIQIARDSDIMMQMLDPKQARELGASLRRIRTEIVAQEHRKKRLRFWQHAR
jgi:hypothetical protein